jgi:hypothetical protein
MSARPCARQKVRHGVPRCDTLLTLYLRGTGAAVGANAEGGAEGGGEGGAEDGAAGAGAGPAEAGCATDRAVRVRA